MRVYTQPARCEGEEGREKEMRVAKLPPRGAFLQRL